ncbi:Sal-like protein 1 [Dermatophagoides farinae]|uniref:Homeotic protein spalt-major n=1 Tax=Dermatophagoides farinae TaxID=6954 RepID=A0A922IF28_DERFA|nr:Sal-like protein 1 [Dermatophagoides farinae]
MAIESLAAAAAAAVAMENSSTVNQQRATSPLNVLSGHWPIANELMMTSPIPSTTTTAPSSFATSMPDMNAFLESLTPLFTDTHIESSSTTIEPKTKVPTLDQDYDEKSDLDDSTHRQCQPSSSSSPKSDRESESITNSNPTRKLISSLLDLKDTNPDAPLPPMMSPPKVDSSEPASFNEPNTLELLQKHTEQALQNTMSGGSFLLNGLSTTDNNELLNFRKGKDGKEDPANRHRCKFCGKVFGSDSALQIHIRSHTGERPFKCNVCGNRFTTKGNLKVHFQRHKAKYPHVKMNPHPVPEHLDKFHPPLEPPSNSQSPPPPPPPPPTSSSSYSQSNTLHIPAIFSSTLIPYANDDAIINKSSNNNHHENDNSENNNQDNNEPNNESMKIEDENSRGEIDDHHDVNEIDDMDDLNDDDDDDDELYEDEFGIPYGLISSKTSLQGLMGLPLNMDANGFSNSVSLPASLAANNSSVAQFPRMSDSMSESDLVEEASKDPILYQNLLPKPGSTDSTWETLMEVQKASETVKLQQLVDNIEHKLQDPNQCIICQRVLSCKSALQMHYRTHTGERPFKCKICGRAFTTKGNLKTHMGVHRVKPPLRMLHQCPICHKQFTNALVLQQHIRLHSIDPNGSNAPDITPEMLNELKNSHMNFPSFIFTCWFQWSISITTTRSRTWFIFP